ncbi:hypothetical protein [Actinoplanes sp. URMC 104]|uniref:hypothetical protein n=1 Tax=Actinoplanes sp. URMC 104 TaxID=3423409 RepID=UPI003F1A1436
MIMQRADGTDFRANVPLALLAPPLAAAAGVATLRLLLAAVTGRGPQWADLAGSVGPAALGAFLGCAVVAAAKGWHRGRVTVSDAGLLLAAARSRGVLIGWDDVVAARVRRRGLLAVLEVVPRDLHALRAELPSRDLPRIRQAGGRPVLSMDVGFLRPGPAELRAALRRHAR